MQEYQVNNDERGKNDTSLPSSQRIGKSQKFAIAILAIFAFVIIIFWFVQFKKSITEPSAFNDTANSNANSGQIDSSASQSEEALKNKDTDHDGLSDWDELNVYHTSPYLEDSDGDGIPDGEEIRRGTDPNCPEGRVCNGSGVSGDQNIINPAAIVASTTPNNTPAVNGGAGQPVNRLINPYLNSQNQLRLKATSSANNAALQSVLNNNIDAASLRQMLLQAGMSKTMLDSISDDILMKSYQQTINSQGGQNSQNP